MSKSAEHIETEIAIARQHGEQTVLKGDLGGIHDDPEKLQKLLDLLEIPHGTEVRISTRAASVIVR